jgi:selenocysteine lyase/cysteine desulfurase
LPLDVSRSPIDFLSADGHKWLLGPEGAGLFWVRRDWVERLRPIGVGWNSVVSGLDFSRIEFRLKPHAGRWEGGTLNVAGVVGLGASLELLLGVGIDHLAERVLSLTDRLCERAAQAGLEIHSSRLPADRSGIVSLTVPGAGPVWVMKQCRERGVVVNQRAGRVRVSPHGYNTAEEIDRLVELLVELRRTASA